MVAATTCRSLEITRKDTKDCKSTFRNHIVQTAMCHHSSFGSSRPEVDTPSSGADHKLPTTTKTTKQNPQFHLTIVYPVAAGSTGNTRASVASASDHFARQNDKFRDLPAIQSNIVMPSKPLKCICLLQQRTQDNSQCGRCIGPASTVIQIAGATSASRTHRCQQPEVQQFYKQLKV